MQQCPEARALSIFKWENKGNATWWGDDGGMLPQGFTFPIKQKLHFPIYQHCNTTKEDKYKTQRKVCKSLVHSSMHSAIQFFVSLLWMPAACCSFTQFHYRLLTHGKISWKLEKLMKVNTEEVLNTGSFHSCKYYYMVYVPTKNTFINCFLAFVRSKRINLTKIMNLY